MRGTRPMLRRCGPNSISPAAARRPAPGCRAVPSITCCPRSSACGASPFAARAADSDGKEREFTANASLLATVMFGARRLWRRCARSTLPRARSWTGIARRCCGSWRRPSAASIRATPRRTREVERRARGGGDVPGSAADLRHAACAGVARRRPRPGHRRASSAHFPTPTRPSPSTSTAAMPLDYGFLDQCVGWPVSPRGPSGFAGRGRGCGVSGHSRAGHFRRARQHHDPGGRSGGGASVQARPADSSSPTAST